MKITVEQIGELVEQSKGENPRITRESLQAFLRNPHSEVNAKSVEYVVSVDYGMSLAEMIAAGQYGWKNSDINADNFPVAGEGIAETKLELVHLNKKASTDEVEAYLEENDLRPATLAELLAFGTMFPEIQRDFPVIALGSSCVRSDGNRFVPYLYRDGSERSLNLSWDDHDWYEIFRFLAVRKS
ncbi:MAG: hypothetical protein GF349_04475 [Candidatus Magasanikbacteria bacterium]|nr:hypothetical protein [Candidatus Magasanikbacteria bacterium]